MLSGDWADVGNGLMVLTERWARCSLASLIPLQTPDVGASRGEPTAAQVAQLVRGVALPDGMTGPASARLIAEPPSLWRRDPPIRVRKHIAAAWLEIAIAEGRKS
jgi:hypothetical protein